MKYQNKKGFTFIETLVVISIFSLIFPLALSILFVIMQQQLRVFSLSEVKRQGDSIVSYLQDTIANNAYTLYDSTGTEVCEADSLSFPASGEPASFRDRFNSDFTINFNEPDLSIDYPPPPIPAPTFAFSAGPLNNSKVRIVNFVMSCERASPFTAPFVSISFTACYNLDGSCITSQVQKTVSLDYQSSIKLRSFPTE